VEVVVMRPLLALALIAGCTTATHDVVHSIPANAVIITADRGGSEQTYIARADALRRSGTPVVIAGQCDSACSILASLPSACVAHGARIGLHQPRQVWVTNGQRLEAGPNLNTQYYRHVTPQIAARVRSMPFNYERPWEMPVTITHAEAPRYGLRQC